VEAKALVKGFGFDVVADGVSVFAGISLGTTAKYLRRSTSGAAGNGLCTTTKYLRGAAGVGLGTTANYLQRAAKAAANSGLGTTIKHVVNQIAGAGNNWAKAHMHNS
jgi:hypothetical protein